MVEQHRFQPENVAITPECRGVMSSSPAEQGRLALVGVNANTDQLRSRAHLTYDEMAAELVLDDSIGAQNTLELLKALPPEVIHDTKNFALHLSRVVDIGGRLYCVGYVRDEQDQLAPRLFYKSQSEGEWRVSPDVVYGVLSKGEKFDSGYVRETRLVDSLSQKLEGMSVQASDSKHSLQRKWLFDHFSVTNLGSRSSHVYREIADQTRLRGLPQELFLFNPGHDFWTKSTERPAREVFANVKIPQDIAPAFVDAPAFYQSRHPVLGLVTTECHPSPHGNLIWHFSYDQAGRVWMSGVTGATETANSYGTDQEVVLLGALDNKPLEYDSQISGLIRETDYCDIPGSSYKDITPLLDNFEVIKQFRAARSIVRTDGVRT